MAPRNSPTVWRRWLAAELKSLREGLGLHQKEVAADCGWSGARLSYLEKGVQVPNEDDLDALLPLYRVAPESVPKFYEAVKYAREKGWWERTDDRDMPEYVREFIGLEQGASVIRAVEPYVVPGLLQTRDYIVANVRNDVTPRTDRQIARIADLRLRRQSVVVATEPASVEAVIDESVLHRLVGDPGVMAEQLTHLAVSNRRSNVHLRVFPFERGTHPAMVSSYRITSFDQLTPVLYLEHRNGASFHDETGIVEEHLLVFNDLASKAYSVDESTATIERVAARFAEGARQVSGIG